MLKSIDSILGRVRRRAYDRFFDLLESPTRKKHNDPNTVVDDSGIQSGWSVLEVGCGSGYFTAALAECVGPCGSVNSIDINPLAVERTIGKMRSEGHPNATASVMDAHRTSFPDESFDAAVVYGVVPAPVIRESALAAEMARVVKSGGRVSVWTAAPFWSPDGFRRAGKFAAAAKTGGVFNFAKV
jgi:ubiquinone/menaquinone biosynthesis C-methylase UbiE